MEEWKDIPDYEGIYQVSNLGNVRSLKFGKTKLLKPGNCNLYYNITLHKNGKGKTFLVHQLVAMTFLNHKPDGLKLVIDHINSDKLDNRSDNLRIVTNRENISKERSDKRNLPTGVYPYNGKYKYRVYITIRGKQKSLGHFNTISEASQAYETALQGINQVD